MSFVESIPSASCSYRPVLNGFRDLRSSCLKIEHYPCWRMVASAYLRTCASVYTTVHEPVRHLRREQKVIESHAVKEALIAQDSGVVQAWNTRRKFLKS